MISQAEPGEEIETTIAHAAARVAAYKIPGYELLREIGQGGHALGVYGHAAAAKRGAGVARRQRRTQALARAWQTQIGDQRLARCGRAQGPVQASRRPLPDRRRTGTGHHQLPLG